MGTKYQSMHVRDNLPHLKEMQETFGARPGGYRVDPWYFRSGLGNKPYWWDEYSKKWRLLKFGDEFEFDDNDIMVKI